MGGLQTVEECSVISAKFKSWLAKLDMFSMSGIFGYCILESVYFPGLSQSWPGIADHIICLDGSHLQNSEDSNIFIHSRILSNILAEADFQWIYVGFIFCRS